MSHHVTWWFYRSAGKWCYYLLPLLIGTMFTPAEVVNILSPCSKCVLDLCRIPREAKKTTRQMRWWLNPLPSSRRKSWISWLAQTPSCRRHGWQVGFEPPVLLWRLILLSKPYESSGFKVQDLKEFQVKPGKGIFWCHSMAHSRDRAWIATWLPRVVKLIKDIKPSHPTREVIPFQQKGIRSTAFGPQNHEKWRF